MADPLAGAIEVLRITDCGEQDVVKIADRINRNGESGLRHRRAANPDGRHRAGFVTIFAVDLRGHLVLVARGIGQIRADIPREIYGRIAG